MNNEIHLDNIKTLPDNLAKLQYCFDNKIFAATTSPDIRGLLEDIRDEVRGYEHNRSIADNDYAMNSDAIINTEDDRHKQGVAWTSLGMDRRPCKSIQGYEIDNLGNVFNTRGELKPYKFRPSQGGRVIQVQQRKLNQRPYFRVSHLVIEAFHDNPPPFGSYRLMYVDGDLNNLKPDNLVCLSRKS